MATRIEWDIGRMVKAFVLTFFCLLFLVSPVSAQQATSTPTPPLSEVERLTLLVTQLLQKQAATDASTVNTSVIIIGFGMLGVILLQLIGVRSLTKPFLNFVETNQKERNEALEERKAAIQREDEAHEALMQRIEADSEKDKSSTRLEIQRTESIQQLAGVTQKIVDDVETRTQSEERGKREVGEISQRFETVVQPINDGIGGIKTKLDSLAERLDQLATFDQVKEQVTPITHELRGVAQRVGDLEHAIRELVETGEHHAVQSDTKDAPTPPLSDTPS